MDSSKDSTKSKRKQKKNLEHKYFIFFSLALEEFFFVRICIVHYLEWTKDSILVLVLLLTHGVFYEPVDFGDFL